MSVVTDIEDALFAHWSHFGRWPAGDLHDSDGLLWFETPIEHLPYNGVIRSRLPDGAAAEAAIGAVLERFRARGVQCFWVVHPSATPADLGSRLIAHGVRPVERVTGMALELATWRPAPVPQDVVFEQVLDDAGLTAYTDLTMNYWEIPEPERELVLALHRHWGPNRAPGHRYIAYIDGEAVGKAYLSLAGPAGVGSIYGMSVRPEARGRGVAAGLTATILRRARDHGCTRVVLHSTEIAIGVYSRFGFIAHCDIPVHATATLWSGEH